MATCTLKRYSEWRRHAAAGCEVCRVRIRDYNAAASKRYRDTGRGGPPPRPRQYDTATRKRAMRLAARHGVKRASDELRIAESTIYAWCRSNGIAPKRP